ncbi:hypothetical protein FZC33_13330 [Labrys sp. KNU-23]|uniref:hypothetical protein n=1 Tax=Labrys sp. KNU-23 TaxID=2789216 RepID=UPI0011EE78FA|nr:hypothetical protein [Labrys sp. KNU-23]QEN87248.1 hypothetical protein FZC33_13330 [Labrys sp. KNU-23]
MRIYFLCLWLLAPIAALPVLVSTPKPATAVAYPWQDLLMLEVMVTETIVLASKEDLGAAEKRIGDFEAVWQNAQTHVRPWDIRLWRLVDQAIMRAGAELRGSERSPVRAKAALSSLLAALSGRVGG